jgi:tetratricopeptide (TPR) repeat protein
MLEACLALRRAIGNPFDIGATLSTLSPVRIQSGDAKAAREGEEEALGIFRQLGDQSAEAIALLHLGEICVHVGEYENARQYLEPAVTIARAIEYKETESDGERTLGQVELELGNLPAARARFARSLEVCEGGEDKRGAAIALWWMGKVDIAGGDLESARSKLSAALHAFQSFEMNGEIVACIEDHAELAQRLGYISAAASLYAAGEAFRERLGLPRPPRRAETWDNAIAAARSALGDAAFDAAWSEGFLWDLKQAVQFALAPKANARVVTT